MLTFNYGFTYFLNKVELPKFISASRMVSDLIWGTFMFSKVKKLKKLQEKKSAADCL